MIMKSVLAIITAAAILFPSLSLTQVSMTEKLAAGQPPLIASSARAMETGCPDESLCRIQWAIDRGVDIVIIWVQQTGDGKYILLSDGTLTRKTNVRDVFPNGAPRRDPGDAVARWHLVNDYTLEEIKELRLLDSEGGDHPVPTLEEALDLIDGQILVVLGVDSFEVESLKVLLEARDTSNLLLFNEGNLPALRAITEATGIGAWTTVTQARSPIEALEQQIEMFGADLKVVDVEYDQLTTDLIVWADQRGVRLSHRGMGREDIALRGGDTKPWLDALDGPANLFVTQHPDAVMKLLGR